MKTNDAFAGLIVPNWAAPKSIKAFSTTRLTPAESSDKHVSDATKRNAFAKFNLGQHVGDCSEQVVKNRAILQGITQHPEPALWLEQTHSTRVIKYSPLQVGFNADASFTRKKQQTCVVMTADCLPILLCSKKGDFVAAVHAGWRGLAGGVLLEALKKYHDQTDLMAWIGPAISQQHFEVGAEVREQFLGKNSKFECFFKALSSQKYLANLAGVAESQLENQGVDVYQSGLCSFADEERFYSYRRDGKTGRMASLIWIE